MDKNHDPDKENGDITNNTSSTGSMGGGDDGDVGASSGGIGINQQWLYPSNLVQREEGGPPILQTNASNGINDNSSDIAVTAAATAAAVCAGCNLRIVDKFYLNALDSKWHTSCLKCSDCGMELESQISCYERDGLILCREDYLRIYGGGLRGNCGSGNVPEGSLSRQCVRCLVSIGRSELVMKARCFLYHVDCFKCVVCDVPLIKGDLFGMFDAVVYCQTHFRQQQEQQMILNDEFNQSFYGFEDTSNSEGSYHATPSGLPGPWATSASPGPDSECNENNNSISSSSRKKRGRRKRDISEDEAGRSCFPFLDPSGGLGEKTKRARTSFKHNQLRIMKSHFQMNQNPDSRELKDLATKTGLDKKVLQVWFQNARAKWRRMNNSQGLGGCPTMVDTSPMDEADPYSGLGGPGMGVGGPTH